MCDIEALLSAYEIDVRFPDVSGMEHLEMLRLRSELAEYIFELSPEQSVRLAAADRILLNQSKLFANAIKKVANLADWRRQLHVSTSHWWWYLDVIQSLPQTSSDPTSRLAA